MVVIWDTPLGAEQGWEFLGQKVGSGQGKAGEEAGAALSPLAASCPSPPGVPEPPENLIPGSVQGQWKLSLSMAGGPFQLKPF